MSDTIEVRAHTRNIRKNPDPRQLPLPLSGLAATVQGVATPRTRAKAPKVPARGSRAVLSPAARAADPETSHGAAEAVQSKRIPAAMLLLGAFDAAGDAGLIDEQAAALARVSGCWWRRCSDLRQLGYITPTGETQPSKAGVQVRICRITGLGRNRLLDHIATARGVV